MHIIPIIPKRKKKPTSSIPKQHLPPIIISSVGNPFPKTSTPSNSPRNLQTTKQPGHYPNEQPRQNALGGKKNESSFPDRKPSDKTG